MQLFLAQISGNQFHLAPTEINHCIKVLRKSIGDTINFITGDGALYEGTIEIASKKLVAGTFSISSPEFGKVPYDLTIAIAPTKNMDRLEWFLEKSIEMGITKVIPLLCDHSERKVVKMERLEKIALSATKQSLKGQLVQLEPLTKFEDFIESCPSNEVCIAHCEDGEKLSLPEVIEHKKDSSLTVMIGPEGDFSSREIELAIAHGITPIHLGKSRLRTETAALVAVSMMYQKYL